MAFGNATKGYVRKHSGGGGGGGTSNYNDLSNKPSINGVTLSGNKSSNDLKITSITDITSDITNSKIGVNISDYDILVIDALDKVQQLFSASFVVSTLIDGLKIMASTTNSYYVEVCHINNGVLYLTKNNIGEPVDINKVYGIKL
jgi:hypothetical protein